jgi:hypothetical protein
VHVQLSRRRLPLAVVTQIRGHSFDDLRAPVSDQRAEKHLSAGPVNPDEASRGAGRHLTHEWRSTTTQVGKEAGGIWEQGVEALRDVFRSTTIADIARREAQEAGAGMYHI